MGGSHARKNERVNRLKEGKSRRNDRISKPLRAEHRMRGSIMIKEGGEDYITSLRVRKTL
jgi:hypothetical protein